MAKLYVRVNLLIEIDYEEVPSKVGNRALVREIVDRTYQDIWNLLHDEGIFVYSGKTSLQGKPPQTEEQS